MWCPKCGRKKKLQIVDFGGGIKRKVPIRCKCESKHIEEYHREIELDKQCEKKRRLERLFQQSRLGERFKTCSFDNFKLIPGTENAYETAKDYIANFNKYRKEGKGIVFSSIPGTGKTHLCGAITNELIKNLTSVIFIVVPELLMKIRNTYNKGVETESQIMYGLTECDLLILDDLGAEKKTDWTTEKLFTVIDSRYRDNRPMIFTTNCSSSELQERIGARTFSRIMEVCQPIKLECDDYRLRKF
jgi:DNA replication protein DnaC